MLQQAKMCIFSTYKRINFASLKNKQSEVANEKKSFIEAKSGTKNGYAMYIEKQHHMNALKREYFIDAKMSDERKYF